MRIGNSEIGTCLFRASAMAAALTLSACGGGGGGGGGGGFFPPPTAGQPAVPGVQLTLTVNGVAVPVDANGTPVKAGQSITVKSSQSVDWSATAGSDRLKARVGTVDSQQYQVRFANANLTSAEDYVLTARIGAATVATLRLRVQAGDSRNGSYRAFVGNGTQQPMTVDFDLGEIETTDAAGNRIAGTLGTPAAGSTVIPVVSALETTTPRVSQVQYQNDVLVGSLPAPVPDSSPPAYAPNVFVASRNLIPTAADLDGNYNTFRTLQAPGLRNTIIMQFQVAGAGTRLRSCTEVAIRRVDDCAAGSVAESRLVPNATPGLWSVIDAATGAAIGRIAVARMGDEKVLLAAGPRPTSPGTTFTVGLPEQAAWTGFASSSGASTLGTTDRSSATATVYSLNTAPTGYTTSLPIPLSGLGMRGMLGGSAGGTNFFVTRSQQLETVVGAANNTAVPGFLHIGLIAR